MDHSFPLTGQVVFETLLLIWFLVRCGRVFSTVNRPQVYHILQALSLGFCTITTVMACALAVGFLKVGVEPAPGIESWLVKFITSEMELWFGPAVFAGGIFLIYGPRYITRALASLFRCQPRIRVVSPAHSKAKLVAIAMAESIGPVWLVEFVEWITPFNVLSLILVKGYVANASALCAVELVGIAANWESMRSFGMAFRAVGASSGCLLAAIALSFALSSIKDPAVARKTIRAFSRSVGSLRHTKIARFIRRIS